MKNPYEVSFRKLERNLLLANLNMIRKATLKK
jgi:hypothetical protein